VTDPLRIGIIGVGGFGAHHLDAYMRQPGVEVVALADANVERAAAVAAQRGVERWFADGTELIAAVRPAGVSVVTPGSRHVVPTVAALEHGCSVLLEKPVAMSSSEVSVIASAERASAGFVVPAHILRFSAPHRALRAQVRDGAVGDLLGIQASRDRTQDHESRYPDIHPAFLTMVHDIDQALWLSSSRAVVVSARGLRWIGGRPTLLWAQVEADDGALWSLRTSWVLRDGTDLADRLEVYGEAGAIALQLPAVIEGDSGGSPDWLSAALDAEIAHFCACLRGGTPSEVITLGEAAHSIQIAEAVVASAARNGAPVEVSA
jgi:predicted dehydrogenase